MYFEVRQSATGPLHVPQHSSESCPIAKSPRGSPNPPAATKESQDETLFSKQRQPKRAVSQSHRLPVRHWRKAKKSL